MTCWKIVTAVCLTLPLPAHSSSSSSNNNNNNNNNNNPSSHYMANTINATATADPSTSSSSSSSSQPLRTLKKLQAMLDETDYVTESNSVANLNSTSHQSEEEPNKEEGAVINDTAAAHSSASLWTSKDRSKYKRQQQLQQSKRQRHVEVEPAPAVLPPSSTADHETDLLDSSGNGNTDDDGLMGYTLPSFPIYFSDGEVSTEDEDAHEDKQEQQQLSTIHNTTTSTTSQSPDDSSDNTLNHLRHNPSMPLSTYPNGDLPSSHVVPSYPWNYYYPHMYSNTGPPPPPPPPPLYPYHTSPSQTQSTPWTHSYNPPFYYGYPPPPQPPSPPPPNYPNYTPPMQTSSQPQYQYPQQEHQQYLQQQPPPSPQYPMDASTNPTIAYPQTAHTLYRPKSLIPNSMTRQQQQQQLLQQQLQQHIQMDSRAPYFIPNTVSSSIENQKNLDIQQSSSLSSSHPKRSTPIEDTSVSSILLLNPDSSVDILDIPSRTTPITSSIFQKTSKHDQIQNANTAALSLSLDSIQKILILMGIVITLCYCAVSPRTLDTLAYQVEFQKNIERLVLAWLPPLVLVLLGIRHGEENNMNSLVRLFYIDMYIYIYFQSRVLNTAFIHSFIHS